MTLRWYAARTKPLKEYAAREQMETAGFEVFLPCVKTLRPRRGRRDTPLFSGYLFLRHDLEGQGWGSMHRLPQFVRLVAFGGVVPPVPDEVITELGRRVAAVNDVGGLWTRFQPGDRVRVALGPMESLGEVVEEAKSSRRRVRVLLDFLGRQVYAQIPRPGLQAVRAEEPLANSNYRPPRRTRGKGRWLRGYNPGNLEGWMPSGHPHENRRLSS